VFKQLAVLLMLAPLSQALADEKIPPAASIKRADSNVESNQTRELAIAAIKSHGAKIEFAGDLPGSPAISVTFISCHMKAGDLAQIEALPEIRHLALNGAVVGNADLVHLAGLKDLMTLDVSDTKIDDAGLKQIAALPSLRTLNLEGTAVTHRGLIHLLSLTNLESLNLCFTREELSNDAVVHLRKLKKLKKLDLSFSALSDDGLKALLDLTDLESLNLENTKVTDAGIKEFQAARPKVTITE
jgi:internalin A